MSEIPVIKVLSTIVLNVNSVRVKPTKLLKPPVEVNVHAMTRILRPLMLEETHLGNKVTAETDFTLLMYLRSSSSKVKHKVLESRISFFIIIEPTDELENFIEKPVDNLPDSVKKQLVTITANHALPLLISLCEKHMLPLPIPIPEIKLES